MEQPMKVIVVSSEWTTRRRSGSPESTNLEGLVTEADTLEALRARLALIVPDLLEEYRETDSDIAIELIAHSHDLVQSSRQAA